MATDASVDEITPLAQHEPSDRRSGVERIVDAFLQESSIKWMLVIGAAIISASSLMLVTRQWTSWPVGLKYFTILSYTAGTFAVAEYCGRRLRLDATSQVLRLLTLLLIPIGFLSLSWLTAGSFSMTDSALSMLLLIPATAFMLFAADRILSDWLRGRQLTFLASYALLALAGVLPVIQTSWLAVLFSSGFWLVMTLGVVKVNRHVFWLTEEHRRPRVFGFLPIAMLASLYVVLTVTKTIGAIPVHWTGFFTVLMAATVLMTTKTIADVFRTRTGNLVHPLPWSIIAPLFTGLVLTAIGVLLSFHGFAFSGSATRAVVPTTLVAAGLVFTLARDTRHRGFVWAGMILVAIAYQSCPTLMGDLIRTIKSGAASAINEEQLPVAFYGLTYAPLLIAFALASRAFGKRGHREFELPFKQFVVCVSIALAAVSLTNLKAAFLVGICSAIGFVFNSIVFRDRTLVLASIASAIVSVATFVPFASAMGIFDADPRWSMTALATFGLLLGIVPGPDRWLSGKAFDQRERVSWFRIAGRTITILVSFLWLISHLLGSAAEFHGGLDRIDWVTLGTLGMSLLWMTYESRNYAIGMWMWLLAMAVTALVVLSTPVNGDVLIAGTAVGSGLLTLSSFLLLRVCGLAISPQRFITYGQPGEGLRCQSPMAAILLPLADLTLAIFAIVVAAFYLPALGWATFTLDVAGLPLAWALVAGIIGAGAVLFRGPIATATASLGAPVVGGLGVGCVYPEWFQYETLPLIYAVSSAGLLLVVRHFVGQMRSIAVTISTVWLALLATSGLLFLSPVTLMSSAIALATLFIVYSENAREWMRYRTSVAILSSVQLILASSTLAGYRGFLFGLPSSELFATASVWMLSSSVLSILLFEYGATWLHNEASRRWGVVLRAFAMLFFVVCLATDGFDLVQRMAVVISLIVAAMHECHVAVRRQDQRHVAGVFVIVGLIIGWFHWQHQIPVPHVVLRSLAVTAAGICLILGRRLTDHPRLGVLVRGQMIAALALPPAVAVWSLFDSGHGPFEMLVMFAASAIWFVHGRVSNARRYTIGSAVMFNVALASLFVSWSLTDPQMYLIPIGLTVIGLVELLRRDIPVSGHDPLRYLGALMILVSPCFEILGGSWVHLVSLMVLSVLVILIAIGLRLRALIHVGSAFLFVDLVAMVIRSTIDHPGMLWAAGLVVGASVIAIAAACEHHRETLLSRIRILSDELSTWR